MFTHGQRVKRIVGSDGCFPALGNCGFVEEVIDDVSFTLQGCGATPYLISSFVADSEPVIAAPKVHELIQAVILIDTWNRTQPTGQMISIEAHCAQDGGSTFMVGQSFDTNNPQELFNQLVHEVSKEELQGLANQFTSMVSKL